MASQMTGPQMAATNNVPVYTHRGGGSLLPMTTMYGSASRTMSPRPRSVPTTGPGRRYGSAEPGNNHGRDGSRQR